MVWWLLACLPMFAFVPASWVSQDDARFVAAVKFGPVIVYSLLRFLALASETRGLKLYPIVSLSALNWFTLTEAAACFSSKYQCHCTAAELASLIGAVWLIDGVFVTYDIVVRALALVKPPVKRD